MNIFSVPKVSPVCSDGKSVETKWTALDPADECRLALNRKPFRLLHSLVGNSLLSLDALEAVAHDKVKRKDDFYFDAGDLAFTDKWGTVPAANLTVSEIFRRLETVGAWIIMHHLELDPAYKSIQDEFGDFFRTNIASPADAKLLGNPDFQVFISSPRRKTPYHFDEETNFLMQVQGSKTIWICDPLDRNVTTETKSSAFTRERFVPRAPSSRKLKRRRPSSFLCLAKRFISPCTPLIGFGTTTPFQYRSRWTLNFHAGNIRISIRPTIIYANWDYRRGRRDVPSWPTARKRSW